MVMVPVLMLVPMAVAMFAVLRMFGVLAVLTMLAVLRVPAHLPLRLLLILIISILTVAVPILPLSRLRKTFAPLMSPYLFGDFTKFSFLFHISSFQSIFRVFPVIFRFTWQFY